MSLTLFGSPNDGERQNEMNLAFLVTLDLAEIGRELKAVHRTTANIKIEPTQDLIIAYPTATPPFSKCRQ